MKAHLLLTACLSLCAADLGVISPRHGILLDHQTTRTDFQKFEVELKHRDTTNVVTLTLTNSLISHSDLVQLPSGRTTMGLKSYFWDGSVSDMAIYSFDLRRAAPPAPSAVRSILRAGSEPPRSLLSELERRYLEHAMRPPPMPSRGHTLTNDHPWAPILESTNGLDMETGLPMTEIHIHLTHTNDIGDTVTGTTRIDPTDLRYCWYRLANNVNCQSTNHDHEVINEIGSQFIPKIKPIPSPRPLPGGTNRTYGEHLDWIEDRKGKRRNE